MKKVRVFAPASIANMGCGFDVIGLALDEVGDILKITQSEGDGLTITNNSGVPLPEDPEVYGGPNQYTVFPDQEL